MSEPENGTRWLPMLHAFDGRCILVSSKLQATALCRFPLMRVIVATTTCCLKKTFSCRGPRAKAWQAHASGGPPARRSTASGKLLTGRLCRLTGNEKTQTTMQRVICFENRPCLIAAWPSDAQFNSGPHHLSIATRLAWAPHNSPKSIFA